MVCAKCARWNLSPLESRWEAIEEAERAYRDTKKRVATDNIGLARLNDGTELIRIGEPLRPEFAAWRYGDQFGRRRTRKLLATAAVVAGTLGFVAGAKALAIYGTVGPLMSPFFMYRRMVHPIAMVQQNDGKFIRITRAGLSTVRVSLTGSQQLRLRFDSFDPRRRAALLSKTGFLDRMMGSKPVHVDVSGERAERALLHMLPILNGYGGTPKTVAAAVEGVEKHQTIAQLVNASPKVPFPSAMKMQLTYGFGLPKQFDNASRLALEMMMHEDTERRALEGELKELESRWIEAEEIAGIADSLTLPTATDERVEQMRMAKSIRTEN